MVVQANIHEAKTHLSRLIERALEGDEVVVAKAGKPLIRLMPIQPETARQPGCAKGLVISMADDFDAPLQDMKDYMA